MAKKHLLVQRPRRGLMVGFGDWTRDSSLRLILHNMASVERTVQVSATLTNQGTVTTVPLGSVQLEPRSTKPDDFKQLLEVNLPAPGTAPSY